MRRRFAFPHAGGGSHSYAKWPEQLPSSIERVALEPPGRGSRLQEPALREFGDMVAHATAASSQVLRTPARSFGTPHKCARWAVVRPHARTSVLTFVSATPRSLPSRSMWPLVVGSKVPG